MLGFKLLSASPEKGEVTSLLIVASRKVGKACVRNKLKRQIRSLFYEYKDSIESRSYVLILYKEASLLKFLAVKKAFFTLFECKKVTKEGGGGISALLLVSIMHSLRPLLSLTTPCLYIESCTKYAERMMYTYPLLIALYYVGCRVICCAPWWPLRMRLRQI